MTQQVLVHKQDMCKTKLVGVTVIFARIDAIGPPLCLVKYVSNKMQLSSVSWLLLSIIITFLFCTCFSV